MNNTNFSKIFAIATIALAIVSCTKDPVSPTEVVHSSTTPTIVCQGMEPNNFCEITNSSAGEKNFIWNSNVPCLAGWDESTSALTSYNAKDSQAALGALTYTLSWNTNGGYTQDAIFAMIQPATEPQYFVYDNYGALETIVTYRMRGAKGSNYMNFADSKNWKNTDPYFVKGEVSSISNVSTGSEDFMNCALTVWNGYFKAMGYTPVYSYDAQYVTLTIKTDQGNVDLQVYGKTRDGEIATLLNFVKVGDTVEVPAIAKSKDDVAAKKLQKVHTSRIMKF